MRPQEQPQPRTRAAGAEAAAFGVGGGLVFTSRGEWGQGPEEKASQADPRPIRTGVAEGLPWWSNGKESAFQCRGRGN